MNLLKSTQSKIKNKVSQNRKRYNKDDYDLDLAYITSYLIGILNKNN
jgi:hypothetical protein